MDESANRLLAYKMLGNASAIKKAELNNGNFVIAGYICGDKGDSEYALLQKTATQEEMSAAILKLNRDDEFTKRVKEITNSLIELIDRYVEVGRV